MAAQEGKATATAMTIQAFRWTGNAVESVTWTEYQVAYAKMPKDIKMVPPRLMSKRERRYEARYGTRGRRGARRVGRYMSQRVLPIGPPVIYEQHRLRANGPPAREALLYVPSGQEPTEAMINAVALEMTRG